jgi:uncharacterized protein (TIGR03435 family)
MMRAAVTAITLFSTSLAYGQPDAKPAFDVASIKPAGPPGVMVTARGGRMVTRMGPSGGPGTKDPTRFTCPGCTLSMLLMQAYDIKRYQLTGPEWLDSERFEVTANVPEGATRDQFKLMLQNLLAERFKLAAHHEKKELPMYDLVVGKNGPKLKESDPPPPVAADAPPDTAPLPPPGKRPLDKDGFPIQPAGRGPAMMMRMEQGAGGTSIMSMKMNEESMEQLATMLSNQVGKPVTDATGLKGKYDIVLNFASDSGPMGRGMLGLPMPPPPPGGGEGGGGAGPAAASPDAPGLTIFGALQAQLGLKLEPKKGQVDTVVVDHMEKVPTEN